MKKLMMAIVIALTVVGFANAAMIQWGTKNTNLTGDGGAFLNGGAAYLVYLGDKTNAIEGDQWNFSASDIVSTAWIAGDGGHLYTSSSSMFGQFSGESFNTKDTGAGRYAIIVTTSEDAAPSAMPLSGYYEVLGYADVSPEIYADASKDVVALTTQSVAVTKPVPSIPEPTTYALVGLAAAALALRKRFLKK